MNIQENHAQEISMDGQDRLKIFQEKISQASCEEADALIKIRDDAFWDACENGDTQTIKALLPSFESHPGPTKDQAQSTKGMGLRMAVKNGHTDTVKYLTAEDKTMSRANPKTRTTRLVLLREACGGGHMETVRYLLSSWEGGRSYDEMDIESGFMAASEKGHIEIMKYLLSSQEIGHHADLSRCGVQSLMKSVLGGHLDAVRYLTSPDELRNPVNPNNNAADAFLEACRTNKTAIAKYLASSTKTAHPLDSFYIRRGIESALKSGSLETMEMLLDAAPEYYEKWRDHICEKNNTGALLEHLNLNEAQTQVFIQMVKDKNTRSMLSGVVIGEGNKKSTTAPHKARTLI